MPQFLIDLKPYLELIALASNVVLTIVGILALQQVTLLKLDMNIRNERAAKEKAIEALTRYQGEFLPLYGVFSQKRLVEDIPEYDGLIGDFTRKSLKQLPKPLLKRYAEVMRLALKQAADKEKPISLTDTSLGIWVRSMNCLESIAATFVTGVADEQIGFSITGRQYVQLINRDYILLSIHRNNKTNNGYQSIIDLYKLWAVRLSKSDLRTEIETLEDAISKLPDNSIAPIGKTS